MGINIETRCPNCNQLNDPQNTVIWCSVCLVEFSQVGKSTKCSECSCENNLNHLVNADFICNGCFNEYGIIFCTDCQKNVTLDSWVDSCANCGGNQYG